MVSMLLGFPRAFLIPLAFNSAAPSVRFFLAAGKLHENARDHDHFVVGTDHEDPLALQVLAFPKLAQSDVRPVGSGQTLLRKDCGSEKYASAYDQCTSNQKLYMLGKQLKIDEEYALLYCLHARVTPQDAIDQVSPLFPTHAASQFIGMN